ncbi:hypothetical protein FORC88_3698 [Salmonella enterica subsp. enterica serovar Typhimurium]|uniref:Uncharacterized protein n=1 Tax=Salmonella schwarzengrund (strain CVM19633) TaxID=439843 RepID=A0A0N1TUR3_SALSV|nr:hypothetical protein SeSA_A0210 [Salmonella enterica subsp. enterica serovar Schwarzengrund str. CVM19633]AJQ72786.1 hypothetical protein AW67_8760 [Salmonella enterica subsp. enterica serovar Montevideo str. USDA-ARS-USMARC-1903]EDY31290.1 hypothetical protein SeSB_A0398 [Salmonella enterica subsp. enterica serovar Schwarzengrund str. SL480]EHC70241.1 hypothetical protein LTSEJOH_0354 [Salmonella enterica subsp. enterica serovar Johannesburg str. S5-703]QCK20848.1 hypothetical protein FORC8
MKITIGFIPLISERSNNTGFLKIILIKNYQYAGAGVC